VSDQMDALARELAGNVKGDLGFDDLTRTLYSTDASIYEIIPAGVVAPRDGDDVVTTVQACRGHGVPVVPRGAGTGLTGGAVGPGIALDLSRYLTGIRELDPTGRTVRVGAGVVLDDLNRAAGAHGLQFAPDVATGNRATLGGMIANNSCGAHSVIYGQTVDHVQELTCVLGDGTLSELSALSSQLSAGGAVAGRVAGTLADVRGRYRDAITARYPKILRKNGGYGLDRLLASEPASPISVLCGSEGTLGVVVEAVLRLTPLPPGKALLVAEYGDLLGALGAVPRALEHEPAAVELIDDMILEAARRANPQLVRRFVSGDPRAILVTEFLDEPGALPDRLARLERDLVANTGASACTVLGDAARQAELWGARKAGVGLLMSRPGDEQPYGFIEDTAVAPARLREYIERLGHTLRGLGVHRVAYYAHASVGCLHVRPVLNLKKAADVERMAAIGDAVSDLVLEFGGSMTAEHGDGIVRSGFLEKMYGPELMQAFREVKTAFDPDGVMNPGKIVDPLPMTANLRYGAGYEALPVRTHLDFSAYGGMAGLAQMCSGVGQCRKQMEGTMCPSYIATGDERHTTRARANALRIALSNRGLLEGLADARLDEVMDLCLSCKACRTECPTGVDLARLKAEWLAYRNRRLGVPRRSRLVADTPRLAVWGSRFAPLSNWVMRSAPVRTFLERRYGLDRRVPPPRFVRRTFRAWFDRRRRRADKRPGPRGRVAYFVDCWTNHYRPEVGIAAVRLLEAAGYEVLAPRLQCCGRPMLSKGLLAEATENARANIKRLAFFGDARVPIVGTEPSCILTLVDEYPQLVRTSDAGRVAGMAMTVETLLARVLREDPAAIRFTELEKRILYHGHCHQKALVGTADALELLNAPPCYSATEIPSGCCGMAGSFGHEAEHYEVARAIGEERLFPAVRARGDAEIAVEGFSCREQVDHHTDASCRHVVEVLADALAPEGEPAPRA